MKLDPYPPTWYSDSLRIAEVFGPTVQGEGPTAGRCAWFLRLAGCNLSCAWCDTPYTWDWDRYDPGTESSRVPLPNVAQQLAGASRVVVTGGEPLLQQDALGNLLVALTVPVEVETNGTLVPNARMIDSVERWNVSPKLDHAGMQPRRRIRPDVLREYVALPNASFKFVTQRLTDLEQVTAIVAEVSIPPERVWIMPEGVTRAAVTRPDLAQAAADLGWNYTARLHTTLWGNERRH